MKAKEMKEYTDLVYKLFHPEHIEMLDMTWNSFTAPYRTWVEECDNWEDMISLCLQNGVTLKSLRCTIKYREAKLKREKDDLDNKWQKWLKKHKEKETEEKARERLQADHKSYERGKRLYDWLGFLVLLTFVSLVFGLALYFTLIILK